MNQQFIDDQIKVQKELHKQIRIRDEAIKQLQAQLDATKWISVDDRLPDVGIPVLIHAPKYIIPLVVAVRGSGDLTHWHFPDEDNFLNVEYAKLWMPLPEPPKECE